MTQATDADREAAVPLPCPFCGGDASGDGKIRYTKNHEAWWADGSQVLEAFHVNCMKCGCSNIGLFGHQTRDKAIAHWNTRHRTASTAALTAENQRLREDFLSQLRRVNSERYDAWATQPMMLCEHCGANSNADAPECAPPFDRKPHSFTRPHPYLTVSNDAGIMFDALELGGEVGELLNVVKKLEREARGWRGSRASDADFANECADVLICLDKLARRRGVDLAAATVAKFNATSDKVGLPHKLALSTPSCEPVAEVDADSIPLDVQPLRVDWNRSKLAAAYDLVEEERRSAGQPHESPLSEACRAALDAIENADIEWDGITKP